MKQLHNRPSERGIALIIVLWITLTIALFVSSFNSIVRSSIKVRDVEQKLLKHSLEIDSGLEIAVMKLINKNKNNRWKADSISKKINYNGKILTITISDPNGLVDLNTSDGRILKNLFSKVTGNRLMSDQITNEVLSRRPKSEKKSDKKEKNPKNEQESKKPQSVQSAPKLNFIDLTQFRRLPGMTAAEYKKIIPYITVHNRDGKINPMTAPLKVLEAIPGISGIQARDLLQRRENLDPKSQYYSDLKTRTGDSLNISESNIYIIKITSLWNGNITKGKKYIVITELDKKRPYRLLSWGNI